MQQKIMKTSHISAMYKKMEHNTIQICIVILYLNNKLASTL